jgi:hypothetical protein
MRHKLGRCVHLKRIIAFCSVTHTPQLTGNPTASQANATLAGLVAAAAALVVVQSPSLPAG